MLHGATRHNAYKISVKPNERDENIWVNENPEVVAEGPTVPWLCANGGGKDEVVLEGGEVMSKNPIFVVLAIG